MHSHTLVPIDSYTYYSYLLLRRAFLTIVYYQPRSRSTYQNHSYTLPLLRPHSRHGCPKPFLFSLTIGFPKKPFSKHHQIINRTLLLAPYFYRISQSSFWEVYYRENNNKNCLIHLWRSNQSSRRSRSRRSKEKIKVAVRACFVNLNPNETKI